MLLTWLYTLSWGTVTIHLADSYTVQSKAGTRAGNCVSAVAWGWFVGNFCPREICPCKLFPLDVARQVHTIKTQLCHCTGLCHNQGLVFKPLHSRK